MVELFEIAEDLFDLERFRRRRSLVTQGKARVMPVPEDVLLQKLRWLHKLNRLKDRNDARDVIAVQYENLDWSYIHRWTDCHGTRGLLDEILRSVPPDLLQG